MGLKSQVHDLQEKTKDVTDLGNFVSKSLPILLHIQISEAMKKVLGSDFEEPLMAFEQFKNKQLFLYNDYAHKGCVKYMHMRM